MKSGRTQLPLALKTIISFAPLRFLLLFSIVYIAILVYFWLEWKIYFCDGNFQGFFSDRCIQGMGSLQRNLVLLFAYIKFIFLPFFSLLVGFFCGKFHALYRMHDWKKLSPMPGIHRWLGFYFLFFLIGICSILLFLPWFLAGTPLAGEHIFTTTFLQIFIPFLGGAILSHLFPPYLPFFSIVAGAYAVLGTSALIELWTSYPEMADKWSRKVLHFIHTPFLSELWAFPGFYLMMAVERICFILSLIILLWLLAFPPRRFSGWLKGLLPALGFAGAYFWMRNSLPVQVLSPYENYPWSELVKHPYKVLQKEIERYVWAEPEKYIRDFYGIRITSWELTFSDDKGGISVLSQVRFEGEVPKVMIFEVGACIRGLKAQANDEARVHVQYPFIGVVVESQLTELHVACLLPRYLILSTGSVIFSTDLHGSMVLRYGYLPPTRFVRYTGREYRYAGYLPSASFVPELMQPHMLAPDAESAEKMRKMAQAVVKDNYPWADRFRIQWDISIPVWVVIQTVQLLEGTGLWRLNRHTSYHFLRPGERYEMPEGEKVAPVPFFTPFWGGVVTSQLMFLQDEGPFQVLTVPSWVPLKSRERAKQMVQELVRVYSSYQKPSHRVLFLEKVKYEVPFAVWFPSGGWEDDAFPRVCLRVVEEASYRKEWLKEWAERAFFCHIYLTSKNYLSVEKSRAWFENRLFSKDRAKFSNLLEQYQKGELHISDLFTLQTSDDAI